MKNQFFLARLGYALNGIRMAILGERSFRFQMLAAVGVAMIAFLLKATPIWWAMLLLTIGAVLAAELFNTALENAIDRLHPERHESIRVAKDCAAGGVLVLSLVSLGVFTAFLIEFWPFE